MTNRTTTPTDPLGLWNSVCTTDPNFTKNFSRSGGFKGTSINLTYQIRRATEAFGGPIGTTWWLEEESHVAEGAPLIADGKVLAYEKVWVTKVSLHYIWNGQLCTKPVVQYGQTTFVGKNKNGWYTDEEAPKKSLSDGLSKCLALLGFSADVHLGLYDDNKYVNDLHRQFDGGGDDHGHGGRQQGQGGNRGQQGRGGQGGQGGDEGRGQAGQQSGGVQQELPPLLTIDEFKARIDAGIQLNEAVPLIGRMFEHQQGLGQVAAFYLIERKIEASKKPEQLSTVASRQKWMHTQGWLTDEQVAKLVEAGKAKDRTMKQQRSAG